MKKGDTIQGRTLYKGGHYLRKYGILIQSFEDYFSHFLLKNKSFYFEEIENDALNIKVKIKSEKYLDGIFKSCFSHNPAVLFSLFHLALWWAFYILLELYYFAIIWPQIGAQRLLFL